MDPDTVVTPINRVRTAPRRESRARRAAILAALLTGPVFLTMVFTVLPPCLPGIAGHFGGGATGQLTAQLVMTLPSIGLMIGGPLSGWIIDRYDARRVMFAALLAYSLLGAAGAVLTDRWSLLASRFLLGFVACALVNATNTLISRRYEPAVRAKLIGYGTFFGAGAGVLSILLSGHIAEARDWHLSFALYGLAVPVLLLAVAVVPVPGAQSAAGTGTTRETGNLTALLPLYGAIALTFVAVFMSNAQLSFLLMGEGITSPAQQAGIIGMASLANGIGGGVYGWMRAWLGPRGVYALMVGMLALGLGTLGLAHSAHWFSIGCAITGFGGGLAVPHFLNLVLDRAAATVRSRALGLAYSSVFFGDFLNPFVIAPISAALGLAGAFRAIAALLCVVLVATLLRRRP
ncbi:MFS transporter [Telluria sp. Tellsp104]